MAKKESKPVKRIEGKPMYASRESVSTVSTKGVQKGKPRPPSND